MKEYRDLETIVLKFFHWYIMFPTTAHYTHYYMQVILSASDLREKREGIRTIFYNLHDCISEYLDQIIESEYRDPLKIKLLIS